MKTPSIPGFDCFFCSQVHSTNDVASQFIEKQTKLFDKKIFWSNIQTHGRGRQGRKWISEKGNLYFSLIIAPDKPLSEFHQLTFITSLALVKALQTIMDNHDLRVKWPNDILLNNKKLCGILLETAFSQSLQKTFIIIGVGINVIKAPKLKTYETCSLYEVLQKKYDLEYILDLFCQQFEIWYDIWISSGFEKIRQAWLANSFKEGTGIQVHQNESIVKGTFKTITKSGQLVILTEDNKELNILSGDITIEN